MSMMMYSLKWALIRGLEHHPGTLRDKRKLVLMFHHTVLEFKIHQSDIFGFCFGGYKFSGFSQKVEMLPFKVILAQMGTHPVRSYFNDIRFIEPV